MLKVAKIFWPIFVAYSTTWAFLSAWWGDGFFLLVWVAYIILGVFMTDRAWNHDEY